MEKQTLENETERDTDDGIQQGKLCAACGHNNICSDEEIEHGLCADCLVHSILQLHPCA